MINVANTLGESTEKDKVSKLLEALEQGGERLKDDAIGLNRNRSTSI